MTDNTDQNEEESYVENRDKILFELQRIYANNSYYRSSKLGNFKSNLSETNEKSYSPIIEDLLIEMNRKRLKKSGGSDNTDCYRCKQFLNEPQNLTETCEKVSVCTEDYMADLNFVQSIVWLKSCTMFKKDVSVEQFHSVFHRQWKSNIRTDTGKSSKSCKQNSSFIINFLNEQGSNSTELNSITRLDNNQENNTNFDSDLEYNNTIDLLNDVEYNESLHISRSNHEEKINKENEIFTEEKNNFCTFASSQSSEKFFNTQICTQQGTNLRNRIISDSNDEYSSCSDMFKDSQESRETNNSTRNKENHLLLQKSNLISEQTSEKFSLNSQSSNVSNETLLKTKDMNFAGLLDHDNFSDITLFSENCLLHTQNCNQLRTSSSIEPSKEMAAIATNNSVTLSNQNNCTPSLQKDSAYDTYQLSIDHALTPHYIQQDNNTDSFLRQKVGYVIPYQKEKSLDDTIALESFATEIIEKDCITAQNQKLSSSQQDSINNRSVNSMTELDKLCSDVKLCISDAKSQNRYSQKHKNSIEDIEYEKSTNKRLKLSSVNENKNREKISSQWLRFTLDTLNADDVAFQSVKTILSAFQDKRMVKQYMRKRRWKNTLEEQAINAVLNFCDVLEPGNKTNACIQEIARVVTNMLDKSIENDELNKVTILTHQTSIILQLCASVQVCVNTIDYLTEKLKFYENILITVINSKRANMYKVINQLHLIFYALDFCLQKYRLILPNKENDRFEEVIIPPVVDLWKKQLNFEGVIVEDSIETRERRWLMILDDFTVIATENFIQFAKKSRKLIDLLTLQCD